MNSFIRSMKWIMLVCGLLTVTMFQAAISPQEWQQQTFGTAIAMSDPLPQIVVRNWGVLVGLIGLMLIYGAFNEANRKMVLVVASVSKGAFVALVLLYGQQLLDSQIRVGVIVDTIMVIVFVAYLIATFKQPRVYAGE